MPCIPRSIIYENYEVVLDTIKFQTSETYQTFDLSRLHICLSRRGQKREKRSRDFKMKSWLQYGHRSYFVPAKTPFTVPTRNELQGRSPLRRPVARCCPRHKPDPSHPKLRRLLPSSTHEMHLPLPGGHHPEQPRLASVALPFPVPLER